MCPTSFRVFGKVIASILVSVISEEPFDIGMVYIYRDTSIKRPILLNATFIIWFCVVTDKNLVIFPQPKFYINLFFLNKL